MAKKNVLTKSDYLSIDEFKKLLQCLHNDKQYIWELYARISFYTALRASDVLTLKWSDILDKNVFAKTEKKTGKTRKIALNEHVQAQVSSLYKKLKKPNVNQYIFKSVRMDEPMSIQHVNRQIKTWKERYNINITNFSTHTFRKTFGRYVYDSSDNKSEALMLLNQIFKHRNIATTKVYICITDDEINSIFQSISI